MGVLIEYGLLRILATLMLVKLDPHPLTLILAVESDTEIHDALFPGVGALTTKWVTAAVEDAKPSSTSKWVYLGRTSTVLRRIGTYHVFVSRKSNFEIPNLAIAFNSGLGQIPSVLTSYNRAEAEADATLLRTLGAQLHCALGPRINPWGSLKLHPRPSKIYGFWSDNGWLAGGFFTNQVHRARDETDLRYGCI
ncbi:hypothetical protein B0H13DRAFT_2362173 [Mycena leptocephala]|nr:hypothetical protein B0H13DRAFT_2362173 [Mycena leptocephala]